MQDISEDAKTEEVIEVDEPFVVGEKSEIFISDVIVFEADVKESEEEEDEE